MRKLVSIIRKIVIYCFVLLLLSVMTIFTYHQYWLSKEADLLKSNGTIVNIMNKDIHVYKEGEGKETFVFMSGSGIAAPVYEMKGLYSKFSKENKVAIVERAGYGYSDIFGDTRDIDTILEQTRTGLKDSGSQPPYILVPHSISGIESIYWAQKYPEEVKAIIGLDIGLPHEYVDHKLSAVDSLMFRGMQFLTTIGVQRLLPHVTYDPEVLKQSFLTNKEKKIFKAISNKKAFNQDMKNEILQTYDNAKKSTELALPNSTPILFLSAYTKQNEHADFTKQKNKNYEAFSDQLHVSEVQKIEGKHSIYLYAPERIYELTTDFINELE
ncbi:alpha/beta hydrolase [Bacillus spongiae]|uniref:Alpha/beta hydrolase n=1 Tax=Bacillus spongiae TaxID=2683610 RepID=A0ABU8HI63_9BACI